MTKDAVRASMYRQVSALQSDWSTFIRTRLLFWGVRWTIGFAVIWAIIAYVPEWWWLWWVGGATAAISMIALIAGHVVVQRKFSRTHAYLDEPKDGD
jgi:hypothetical protein